jgi:predicted nucleotide-binding protein (sugar kinase/HSP70/actin superfamily)
MFKKHIIMLITTAFIIGSFATGCNLFNGESNLEKSLDKLDTELIKKEKEKEKKAYKAEHSNYTYSQKNIFVDRKRNELAEIKKEVDALTVRLDNSKIKADAEANKKLNALLDELEMTIINIEELQNADESKWEAAKTDFNNIYSNMTSSFEKTRQWLSDKIEP